MTRPRDKGGDFRLSDPEQFRGLALSEFSFGDDVSDALDELGLSECEVWVWKSKVCEDVSAAGDAANDRVSRGLRQLVALPISHGVAPHLSAGLVVAITLRVMKPSIGGAVGSRPSARHAERDGYEQFTAWHHRKLIQRFKLL